MSAETYQADTNRHDPLCPALNRGAVWEPEMCVCDVIAKVRADEREKVLAEGPYFTTVVHDCCMELQDIKADRGEAS